eukprot:GFYU01004052.1.p1 GENE.GFYU01004052.1~~GFYU01004052.1.p1  ORF type:complete len:282 (+),score=103.53 GFYU01004052.1:29-847(+)
MSSDKAEALKKEGNTLFGQKKYTPALAKYNEAIKLAPNNHLIYGNRSATNSLLAKYEDALSDALKAIEIEPKWIKGYYRACTAYTGLNRHGDAAEIVKKGLQVEPNNADLKQKFEECESEHKRIERMNSMSKTQWSNMDTSNMSHVEKARIKGNECFQNGKLPEAIKFYTEALEDKKCTDEDKIKLYNNRAQCYRQLDNVDQVIADCGKVLELDPKNLKALLRRAMTLESIEKYKRAMDDMQQILQIDAGGEIGMKASQAIPRLKRAIQSHV